MGIHLYRSQPIAKVSFAGVQRATVPNQSMSLREIIKRFVRREPLPLMREGIYEDRFGDLEKMKHDDIVVQMENVEELKSSIDDFQKKEKAKADKAKASSVPPPTPVPPPTIQTTSGEGNTAQNPPS